MFQVVEKSNGSDWQLVRSISNIHSTVLHRYSTEDEAKKDAVGYITEINCNNALAKDEKLNAIEVFMMTDDGAFLGILDGKEWYMTYPKDIYGIDKDKTKKLLHSKGERVKDRNFFMLDGKSEVKVRSMPGK